MMSPRQIRAKKIGLALGSGSARACAHIGVIRALSEAGVHIDCVAGTSMGSLIGAVFAAGEVAAFEQIAREIDWKQLVSFIDLVFPASGLIDGRKVAAFVRGQVRERRVEDLPVPFCAVATDLSTGREVVLREGDLIDAIRASISIPGIFTPIRVQGRVLVDGGLVNPVPVSVAREMGADFVIAVDVNHDLVGKRAAPGNEAATTQGDAELAPSTDAGNKFWQTLRARLDTMQTPVLSQLREWMNREPLPNIFEVLTTSVNIMEACITATRLKTDPPDLLIQPKLGHIGFLEFNRAPEAIAEGYRQAKACIDDLMEAQS